MAASTPIHALSARQLAKALEAGELTSVQIVTALHARADAVDGVVHGWVFQRREEALVEARAADEARARGELSGPLHGLPISIKENLAFTGTPATMGIRSRLGTLATEDAAIVACAREAGAIVLGKSNVPLLLLSMESNNEIWGTTHNPWKHDRAPGGSSGGEAALISSGQSPWGFGTDIGGSIRIPCAWCGIPGIKPTEGRWSTMGSAGGQPGQEVVTAVSGPMARTVDDVIWLMETISPTLQRKLDPRVPPVPFQDPRAIDIKGMRVGIYQDDGVFSPAVSVRRAVDAAARALEDLGAVLVPYSPPNSWELVDLYFGGVSGDGARTARELVGPDQKPTPQLSTLMRLARLPAWVRKALAWLTDQLGEARVSRVLRSFGDKPATALWAMSASRTAMQRAELAAWDRAGIDLLVGPPTVTPAAILGKTGDWSLGAWHTMRYNLLAMPAGVVPVSRVRSTETNRLRLDDRLDKRAAEFEKDSTGLPVCAQIIARPWQDELVLAAMLAVEEAMRSNQDYPTTPVDPKP